MEVRSVLSILIFHPTVTIDDVKKNLTLFVPTILRSDMGSNETSWWFQPNLKNISQNGNLLQVGLNIKNI